MAVCQLKAYPLIKCLAQAPQFLLESQNYRQ